MAPKEKLEFDFSEFHDLMHRWWEPYCATLPGGRIGHLKLWLEFKAPDPIGNLMCKLGYHDKVPYWSGPGLDFSEEYITGYECSRCWCEL